MGYFVICGLNWVNLNDVSGALPKQAVLSSDQITVPVFVNEGWVAHVRDYAGRLRPCRPDVRHHDVSRRGWCRWL